MKVKCFKIRFPAGHLHLWNQGFQGWELPHKNGLFLLGDSLVPGHRYSLLSKQILLPSCGQWRFDAPEVSDTHQQAGETITKNSGSAPPAHFSLERQICRAQHYTLNKVRETKCCCRGDEGLLTPLLERTATGFVAEIQGSVVLT